MLKLRSENELVAQLAGVSAGYEARTVLDNVSLRLQAGGIVALAGPNGAGKSTLIRVLTGTLPVRSGTVECSKAQTSLVPQEIALYPWLTARENCLAFAMMDGMSRRQALQQAPVALGMTRCDAIADTRVSQLSGGYRRRVNIAVALMRTPRLLILDEPTAGLDADAKRVVRDVMLQIRDAGCAILVVTHDFDVVEQIADRVAILSAGRLIRDAAPDDLIDSLCDGRKPVELLLASEPDPQQAKVLRQHGAVPFGHLRWMALQPPGSTDLGAISAVVAEAGLRVVEIRMREPNLADAYARLIQAEG